MKRILPACLFLLILISHISAEGSEPDFIVRPDGSFDITGSEVSLLNCYPAIDGRLIKPISVKTRVTTEHTSIIYKLSDGIFELIIQKENETVTIETQIKGDVIRAITVSPIARAEVAGAERFYRTPWAIADDAGIRNWPSDKKKERSNSITGLIPTEGNTLVVSTRDYRKFFSYTDMFPAGLLHENKILDVTILTEQVDAQVLPKIYITEASTSFDAMRNEAMKVAEAMGARNQTPLTYHWCSWYYAYFYLTAEKLSDYLDGFETVQPRVPIKTVQIDVGYFPHVGDWLEPSCNFPEGVMGSVTKIRNYGYNAGIWIAPYMVGNRSKLYQEHPEWVLRNLDGSMAHINRFYEENRLWGAMDEEYYLLDTSNPEVMEYLRNVFRTFRKMGITFFKTDFMFWGAKSSNEVVRHTPGKTSAEYQRELYEMIRKEIGEDSFWLGCISNYAPMIGFADAMRISWDIGANWSYAENFFREVQGQQFLNNVWWQNDPDAIILRDRFNHMKPHEVETLALYMGMLGGAVNTSDLFHEMSEKYLQIFRFLEPGNNKNTAYFPLLEKDTKTDVLVRELKPGKGWALLFVNKGNTPLIEKFELKELTGLKRATCYLWNTEGNILMGEQEELVIELAPHFSKLMYISGDGKAPDDINFAGKIIHTK